MGKIRNTFNRAGAGIRKVGHVTNRASSTPYGIATIAVVGMLTTSGLAWVDGHNNGRFDGYMAGVEAQRTVGEAAQATAVKNAVRRAQRAERGMLEIDQLPQGVDRVAAAKAEAAGKAFAFRGYVDGGTHGDIPCVAVLRLPSGEQVTFTMQPDATGFAEPFGPQLNGISCNRLSGIPTPPRPPVTERPQLWDAAIRKGQAYVYDVPGNGQDGDGAPTFERPTYAIGAIRLDVRRCTGFFIPKSLDRAGQPVEASAPLIDEGNAVYCWGRNADARYP